MASASCQWRYNSNTRFFQTLQQKDPCGKGLRIGWGASLVVQRLRIHLAMQGTLVQSPVREDPTRLGAAESRCWQLINLESGSCNYWNLHTPEFVLPNKRSPHTTAGVWLPPATCSHKDPPQTKLKIIKTNEYFEKKGQGVCLTGFSWGFCCLERILSKKTWFFFFSPASCFNSFLFNFLTFKSVLNWAFLGYRILKLFHAGENRNPTSNLKYKIAYGHRESCKTVWMLKFRGLWKSHVFHLTCKVRTTGRSVVEFHPGLGDLAS